MIPTTKELEDGRHRADGIYGYFKSFCWWNSCCEDCDKVIRFGCRVKRLIEKMQTRRILKICKEETWEYQ